MAYFGQNIGNGASIDPQVAPISPLQLAQTGYYNSLSGINRQNMPIQAQDAANRNALSQQAIQTGQMALDENKQQQTDAAIIQQQAAGASSWAPAQSNTTTQQAPSTAATAPQGAPITSAGPVRAQTPQVQAPGLSSLLTNPNALTANQSQVMQWQNPSSAQTNPGAQNAPILPPPPLKAYPLIGAPGANDPAILNHPELQAVTGAHNNQDTSGAVGSNPTFNAVQTYDAKGPDGQSGQFTLSRAKIISNLMDPNRPSAGPGDPGGARPDLANGLVKQWTDGDLQSEKAKQSALVVQHATLAGKIAAFEALPDYMKPDAYGSLMQETQQEGIKTAGILPDTYDPSDKTGMAQIKNFESQASTVAEREKAQLDKINSQINQQKADSEVKLQGAQASEIPSKIGLNRAEAGKASAEAAKARSETIAPTAPSGSYPLNPNINPKDAKTAPNDMTLAPQNRGIDLTRVPTEQQGIIKSLVNGDLLLTDIPSRTSTGATKLQIERWLTDAAPNYSAPQMELQKKALGTFASKNGDNINSLNTLSEHLQLARYLAPALNNGDVTAWNQLGNSLGEQFGKDNKTNFETLTGVLGGETDKFMSGNNPTQTGSAEWQKRLKSSGSPTQIEGTLQTLEKAVGGKFSGIAQAYKQATGGRRYLTDQDTNFLTPQASALMQKYEPGAGRPSTPQPAASQPPANYNKQQAIQDAKAAIAAGAPRDAVLARSKSIGHDLTGAF